MVTSVTGSENDDKPSKIMGFMVTKFWLRLGYHWLRKEQYGRAYQADIQRLLENI